MAQEQTTEILPLEIWDCWVCCSEFARERAAWTSASSEEPNEADADALAMVIAITTIRIRALHRFHTANEGRPEAEIIRKLRSAGGPAEEAPAIPLNSAGDGPCLTCFTAAADLTEEYKQGLRTKKALYAKFRTIFEQHDDDGHNQGFIA